MREFITICESLDAGTVDVYHASSHKFDVFAPYSHFGSLGAARTVMGIKKLFSGKERTIYLYHCRIHLTNPLHLSYEEADDDAALWDSVRKGKYDNIYPSLRDWAHDHTARLEAFGFDGIIYPNTLDDDGRPSYIVFDPANIEILSVTQNIAEAAPSLVCAIRHNGKIYRGKPGENHLDVLNDLPLEVKKSAYLDGNNRGFVNHKGQFLNRERAQTYAVQHDLLSQSAPSWASGARELTAEVLPRAI